MARDKDIPVYEIGELDKTRQNLGHMDDNEAMRMSKVLGGKVGVERAKKQGTIITRNTSNSASTGAKDSSQSRITTSNSSSVQTKKETKPKYTIPVATTGEEKLFYNYLIDFEICKKASLFEFIFSLGKVKATNLSPYFIKKTIPACIKQIGIFIDAVQKLVNNATPQYKATIMLENDTFSKTIANIYKWNNLKLVELAAVLEKEPKPTIENAVPFVKELFKYIMKFYLLGEEKMIDQLKQLYAEASEEKAMYKARNTELAKQAASSWVYITEHIYFRMYPLLMRITSNQFTEYANFYTQNSQKIFPFLEITKFDIITPEKNNPEKTKTAEKEVKAKNQAPVKKEIHQSTLQSLNVLNNFFPNAGWQRLDRNPDMYVYFKSQYTFSESFSMLSPETPLQILLILLKIMEDLFRGFRTINFENPAIVTNPSDFFDEDDTLASVMAEWPYYCNELFNKELFPELREYVYRAESQQDFITSKYGKKQLSSWLWKLKYYFLPHLDFDIVYLERNGQTFQTKPLARRVKQTTAYLTELIRTCDTNPAQKAFFDTEYQYEVSTPMSFRLNILLQGKKTKLNLLKYALHIIRVLDWWINDEDSLAYEDRIRIPYRTSGADIIASMQPVNHKELFIAYTKKRLAERAAQNND